MAEFILLVQFGFDFGAGPERKVQKEGGPRPGMITMSFLKGGKPGISARRIIVSCEYKLIAGTIG
jgi:hypothetical protein